MKDHSTADRPEAAANSDQRRPARDADDAPVRGPVVFTRRSRVYFERRRRRELIRSLGRSPTVAETILIDRITRAEWDLRRLDARLDSAGELSPYAMRVRHATENRLRLDLTALGIRQPSLPDDALQRYIREAKRRVAARDADALASLEQGGAP